MNETNRPSILRIRELRSNATPAERALWQRLRNRQLAATRFNRQVPIGPYICDFVARMPKLVIELDGGQHAVRTLEDGQRTAFLASRGIALFGSGTTMSWTIWRVCLR